ncbi:hypothetical protein CYV19_13310 [Natronobacterium gregoryi SP2]|uniref:Uncharacterized protein n=1 Tax=Natronobacterium gregoryi (strain ATCC 43098 / DSM 3393 / CCM 3738 / CIP 104747 / IAM 13177 / JCM 8860 / NBRC 102187 / NCIMB 2189 / SP2) TaxID=797304 RepID=A0A2J4JCP2_NATGS|nr:hypothetical protein CYV19_13310 [Natronobacterium gregoryi SP2]
METSLATATVSVGFVPANLFWTCRSSHLELPNGHEDIAASITIQEFVSNCILGTIDGTE